LFWPKPFWVIRHSYDLRLIASAPRLSNHVLLDCDKRLTWPAAVTFLAFNGVPIPDLDVDAAEAFILGARPPHRRGSHGGQPAGLCGH
jgi:hypothetical protein